MSWGEKERVEATLPSGLKVSVAVPLGREDKGRIIDRATLEEGEAVVLKNGEFLHLPEFRVMPRGASTAPDSHPRRFERRDVEAMLALVKEWEDKQARGARGKRVQGAQWRLPSGAYVGVQLPLTVDEVVMLEERATLDPGIEMQDYGSAGKPLYIPGVLAEEAGTVRGRFYAEDVRVLLATAEAATLELRLRERMKYFGVTWQCACCGSQEERELPPADPALREMLRSYAACVEAVRRLGPRWDECHRCHQVTEHHVVGYERPPLLPGEDALARSEYDDDGSEIRTDLPHPPRL